MTNRCRKLGNRFKICLGRIFGTADRLGHDQDYEASLWTFDIFLKMKFANKSRIFQLSGTKICTLKDTNILEWSESKFFKKIPLLQNYDKKLTLFLSFV